MTDLRAGRLLSTDWAAVRAGQVLPGERRGGSHITHITLPRTPTHQHTATTGSYYHSIDFVYSDFLLFSGAVNIQSLLRQT